MRLVSEACCGSAVLLLLIAAAIVTQCIGSMPVRRVSQISSTAHDQQDSIYTTHTTCT